MTLKLKIEEESDITNYLWHENKIIASGHIDTVRKSCNRLLNSGIKHIILEIKRR